MRTADTGKGDEAEGDVDDSNNLYSCSRESCRERSGGGKETLDLCKFNSIISK